MRRQRNFSNSIVILVVAFAFCFSTNGFGADRRSRQSGDKPLKVSLEPLGLPQDTVIIVTPNSAAEKRLLEEIKSGSLSGSRPDSAHARIDSTLSQVYRVQLLTVDTYSDARRELAIAEEIFDLPVSLAYDQPYYKLRVGEFATKSDADSYLLRAKSAGYPNGWVLLTNVGVRELRPLYDSSPNNPKNDSARSTNELRD